MVVLAEPKAGDVTSVPAYLYMTIAATQYIEISEIWRKAKDLGKSLGFSISSRNPKNATCPAVNTLSVIFTMKIISMPYHMRKQCLRQREMPPET
jgi:hypothetical protein